MRDGEKKLKRGLKDISTLFAGEDPKSRAAEKPVLPQAAGGVRTISLFSPDYPADSLFLNSYIASQLSSPADSCSVISLQNECETEAGLSARVRENEDGSAPVHYSLCWDEFEQVCAGPVPPQRAGASRRQTLFLKTDPLAVQHYNKLIPVLDKIVFFALPAVESLMEIYKLIKGTRSLNSRVQYYLILEGDWTCEHGSFLFEKLAVMLSEKLGVTLVWLGYFQPSSARGSGQPDMNLEPLLLADPPSSDAGAKFALAAYLSEALSRAQETAV